MNPLEPLVPKIVVPNTITGRASLYQIGLALVFLYLVMKYVPGGKTFGWMVLALAVLETPNATRAFDALVNKIQHPRG